MGVEIIDRTYVNQFKPASTTNWLLGNVGDWQKMSFTAQFSVNEEFTEQNTISLSEPDIIILNSGENWKDKGFYVGLNITLKYDINFGVPSPNTPPLTVIAILGNEMQVGNQTGGTFAGWGHDANFPQAIPGVINGDGVVQDVSIFGDVRPEGIRVDYAQVTNSSIPSGNLASTIDGTITSLVKEGSNTMGQSVGNPTGIGVAEFFTHQLNFKSGLSLARATVTYTGANAANNGAPQYNYNIQITYMLSPFYDDITNLQNNVAPDSVLSAEALTDSMIISGFPVYNNPNISVTNDPKKTAQLGNTGWFDENFNQLPNPFTFTPVVYKNAAGTTISQLDYVNPVTVTTTISGLANLPNSMFQYGFIWTTLDEDVYKDTIYPFHESMKVSTGGTVEASTMLDVCAEGIFYTNLRKGYSREGTGNESMDVTAVSFIANGADIDVSITFAPTAAFGAFMEAKSENDRQYVLWVSIGDPAPDTNQGDRVSLKLDFNTMETYVEPIGPWDGMTINFLDHPQDSTDTPVLCGNELFVEDDLLAKIEWQVDTAVSDTVPIPTAQTFGILAQRASDEFQYVLDKNAVDLTQFPDVTQYNFDTSRGFKLGVGNTKNWFKVDYLAPAGGTLEDVVSWYGFKVRWEDWIKRFPVAPQAFYDNTLGSNGLANDWYDYFNTTGWDLFFYVNTAATLNGQSVVYQNLKSMSINDYDTNGDISTAMQTFQDSNGTKGTVISAGGGDGVILSNEIVWVDILYTWIGGLAPADWATQLTVDANVYATLCVLPDGGTEKSFRQLSSVWLPELDNPVLPLPAPAVVTTLLTLTSVSATEILVSGRIEANKLIDASRYRISGRIGCK
jgi:hypothetical protein